MSHLPRMRPKRLKGDEPVGLHHVQEFWQWAFSDLRSNTLRGVFAEWLVATATGTAGGLREEWAPSDLRVEDVNVEVKSAAYVQSWFQPKPSRIEFSIAETTAWDADTGRYEGTSRRQADVYVFCLLGDEKSATVDPLDLTKWRFFILPTAVLDDRVPKQKKIALSSLLALKPVEAGYDELRATIADAGAVHK